MVLSTPWIGVLPRGWSRRGGRERDGDAALLALVRGLVGPAAGDQGVALRRDSRPSAFSAAACWRCSCAPLAQPGTQTTSRGGYDQLSPMHAEQDLNGATQNKKKKKNELLGAVRRMATEFDIHTAESGTIVFTRLNQQAAVVVDKALFRWSVISRPAPHEVVCGDSWRIAAQADELAILIADGLGHGPQAAEAALGAALAFDADPFASPSEIVRSADARMQGSRGGAVASALINGRSRKLRYCGVGNIAGSIRSCSERNHRGLVSHNGIVGAQIHKIQEFEYDCPTNGLLIVYSDGLQSRWSLDAYPGLELRHPALIASVLFRDFTRGRDDVTVCAVRFTLD